MLFLTSASDARPVGPGFDTLFYGYYLGALLSEAEPAVQDTTLYL